MVLLCVLVKSANRDVYIMVRTDIRDDIGSFLYADRHYPFPLVNICFIMQDL